MRRTFRFLSASLFCLSVAANCSPVEASPGFGSNLGLRANSVESGRKSVFQVPSALRGRVNFWIDVFSKYGKHQVVIHHRNFPQIVFGSLDFSKAAVEMGPGAYERHREATVNRTIAAVKANLAKLATGQDPENVFQKRIVEQMKFVPGGPERFKQMIDEDLVRSQTGIREKYGLALERASRYLPIMEHIFVSEHGLPRELTMLPFIESSFDYTAYSSVGAAGLWQFMPRTGKSFGMTIGRYVDDRRDPIKATRAAAQYLKDAYRRLGSWPLAITSYNHGVAGVSKKVSRAGTSDIGEILEHPTERYFGFASTNFFPEFLAAIELYEQHERYFPEIQLQQPLRLVSVPLKGSMSAAYVSRLIGVDFDTLRQSNYALLEPIWKGTAKIPGGYQLRVPLEYREKLSKLEGAYEPSTRPASSSASSVYGGLTYKVRRGDTLAVIAKRYKVSPADIQKWNGFRGTALKTGQNLIVRPKTVGSEAPGSSNIEANAAQAAKTRNSSTVLRSTQRPEPKQPEKRASKPSGGTYKVKSGDSLWSVSKKLGVSVKALQKANGLKGNSIKPGKVLVVPR